jgi:hypothetical protein
MAGLFKTLCTVFVSILLSASIAVSEERGDSLPRSRLQGEGGIVETEHHLQFSMFHFSVKMSDLSLTGTGIGYMLYSLSTDTGVYESLIETDEEYSNAIYDLVTAYVNSPIKITGFSIESPSRISIDFLLEIPIGREP